jgi:alcohol dehydrogenase
MAALLTLGPAWAQTAADAALLDPSLVTNPRSVSRAQVVEVYRHAHGRQCATDWRTSQPAG